MRPTNDERKRIADRLTANVQNSMLWADSYRGLEWCLYQTIGKHTSEEIIARLAELIEPNCEVDG